ncbi:MAG: GTP-binding protein TypA [Parcubacteria group bacterium GW2011_GWA2_38_13b]|nr:MAG: GTP-binding protein TypA [Parcubacteria group bacterium GW2011_GWA2_38_13b]
MEIRNIAIIAHVDHGKTTMVDAILRQTGMVKDANLSMDSNDLEIERGITIYAKNTSVFYRGTKINIVDTPGHSDFGSEVERVLRSIDNVLLLVDAQEGPMPQTRFVLKKSLELGLKPIVVINKIDKPAARPEIVKEQIFELFLDLGANDEQLDFTTVYAIGREGVSKNNLEDKNSDLTPLLDTVLLKIKPAKSEKTTPLLFQPFNLGYDNFLGRMAIGRIYEGSIRCGQNLFLKKLDGETKNGKITKIFTFNGLKREEIPEAGAGDIIMISGFPDIDIGETVCEKPEQNSLPAIIVDAPTISLNFLANDSPLAGTEGKFVTTKQLRERLQKELEINVGLKVDFMPDFYKVYGRGELHIAILLENMRREGYELQVSQPQVIIKEKDGIKLEPYEEITIDIPEKYSGTVIEKMGKRKGNMIIMENNGGQIKMIFEIPTRGLLGYRNEFMVDTKGNGIICNRFLEFRPYAGEIKKRDVGSMISMENGKISGYALWNLQNRGVLYVEPAMEVYEGMVIGNTSKGDDMAVNPIKGKQLTNMRASGTDEAIQLTPPFILTLERGMEVMAADEYLEITPKNVRLRKQILRQVDRNRASR